MNINNQLRIIILSLLSLSTFAQTSKKTLNYQAVILDPKAIDIPGASIVGQPLNKGNVCLRFSLLNAQGGLDYEETQQVITDEYGLVNVAIGTGTQASSNSMSIYKSFESVVWNSNVKSLKVSVSYDACNSFKQVSSQALNYTPYALYAEAVDYKNVREAPTKLSQFSNDAGYLIPKDLDPLKADIKTNTSQLATANQTIADNKKSSDAAFLIANQNITSLDTKVAANTIAIKENTISITTINTKLTDQQNQIMDNRNQITATNNNLNTQIGGLQGQLNTTNSTVSNLTGTAEVVSNKSTSVNLGGANPSDQLYPSQKAAKAYVDQSISQVASSGVPDATTLATGKVQLSGDLGGTAALPTVPALAGKENSINKSTNVQNDATSDTKYPSVKAVKDYVDQATLGTALQATVDGKADKNSPTFTGTPVLPAGTTGVTQISSDNSTKLATTAFVQAATSGIVLQAAVDAKADKNSPTFTGTPVLPTGTTGVTQTAGDNSTKLATTAYVDAQVSAGAADASSSTKGIVKLTGDLGGTALAPTVPGLALKANTSDVTTSLGLKEDISNKSNAALGASTTLYPTQNAVKTYVDAQVASGAPDADATTKGKLQLAGDLGGTAISPSVVKLRGTPISSLAPTTAGHVLTYDVSGSATWAAPANSANTISGVVPVANGGTGLSSVTNGGAVYASSSSALTTGTLPITAGGTGAITQQAAINILTGTQSTGKYLRSDGTDARLTSIQVSDVPILNQNTTGSAANVTGKVDVANGGTGASTLTGILKGNGTAALTSAVAGTDYQAPITLTTTGSGSATLSGTTLNIPSVSSTVNAGNISGTVSIANGGTGQTTVLGIRTILGLYSNAVSLGNQNSGQTNQATDAVSIGGAAGSSNQGSQSVAIGYVAGQSSQGLNSIAIGGGAGQTSQGASSIAIGFAAGQNSQGTNSISIGKYSFASANSVALGNNATTGTYSNSTSLGNGAVVLSDNTVQLGNTSVNNVKTSGTLTAGTVTYPNTNGTTGQVLSATASGTITWTTVSAGSSNTHTIGEVYGGGIVFYVWDGGAHGLIAPFNSISRQSTNPLPPITESNIAVNSSLTGVTADGLLAGKSNTMLIMANQGTSLYAASYCYNYKNPTSKTFNAVTYTFPIFSDWYLPSIYEINLFRAYVVNIHASKGIYTNFGNNLIYYNGTTGNGNDYAWGKYLSSTMTGQRYKLYYLESGLEDGSTAYNGWTEYDRLVVMPIRSF